MEFEKVIDAITACWQIKCAASVALTVFTYLVGDENATFLALWVLVFFDMLTRWAAVAKRVRDDHNNINDSIVAGFIYAWEIRALNSREMRRMFAQKIFSYLVLIIAANLLMKILPSMVINGNDWAKIPSSFIYSFLALTEMMSIIENLIEMGVNALKPLAFFFCKKRNELTGYKEKGEN